MVDVVLFWLLAALLLVVLLVLARLLLRRDPTVAPADAVPCPACPGKLRACSRCGGHWRDRRCTGCRLGRICTQCHRSWSYYVKNERNAR